MTFDTDPNTPEPLDEVALLKQHRQDMFDLHFNPEVPPRAPNGEEEPVMDSEGERVVDLQADTPEVDGETVRAELDMGIVDPIAPIEFDGLAAVDLDPPEGDL